jgi:hemolysin activation/secretion protein
LNYCDQKQDVVSKKIDFRALGGFFAKNTQKSVIFSLFSLVGMSFAYGAGTPVTPPHPDAGQVLKEIERDLEVKPIRPLPEVEAPAAVEEEQGPKVVIHTFQFEGNKIISDEELRAALASLTDKEITISELQSATGIIASLYRQKGYLATATLPDQDITEGVVKVVIQEAIFGRVKFDGQYNKDFKRVKPQVITRFIDGSVEAGKPLDQEKLDAAMIEVNKLAGIHVTSTLQAGEAEGATDVLLNVKDQPLLSSYLSFDNTGSRQTGRDKALANLTLASPLGYGETLNLTGLHTEGSDYGKVGVSVPVGVHGLIVGASASTMSYDVVASESAGLGLRGHTSTFAATAQYPLLKTNNGSLGLTFEADKKNFVNQSAAQGVVSNYDLQVFSMVLSGDFSDNFLSGAITSASLDLGAGYVNLNGSANQSTDAAGPNTQGSYSRLRWNINRNQFLLDSLALSLTGSGQFADSNLDSSEKLYLGGSSGVRAYPTSEGGGSEGYLVNAELRKYLPHDLSVATFVDYGFIKQYQNNTNAAGAAIAALNDYHLSGYGLTASWQGPYNTSLKATYAHRFGNNPNPTSTGNDQSGDRVLDVFWLSGSVSF